MNTLIFFQTACTKIYCNAKGNEGWHKTTKTAKLCHNNVDIYLVYIAILTSVMMTSIGDTKLAWEG